MKQVAAVFLDTTRQVAKKMQGYSFEFIKCSEVSTFEDRAPNILKLEFAVQPSGNELCFSLDINSGALLGVSIKKRNGSYFTIDDYLTKYKMQDLADKIFGQSENVSTALHLIIDLFNNDMNDIITGKRWEDVPRDWKGYK